MGSKCFFWKGLRVPGSLIHWLPVPEPQSTIEKQGTGRKLGKLGTRSRNYLWTIRTKTQVSPRTAIDLSSDLDLTPQGHLNVAMLKWLGAAVDLSRELGDLAWCDDDAFKLTLSGAVLPGSYPNAATLQTVGAGFTPAVGFYILVRDPDSGEGFVTQVTGVSGADVSCVIPQAISTDWEVFLVPWYFPSTAFIAPEGWDPESQSDNKWIPDLRMTFKSEANPVYAPQYDAVIALDITNG